MMQNLKLFDLLPNGVIVFKNGTIEHLNQHILNVFNIDFLDTKDAVAVILKTINVKNEKALFSFFTTNDYFIHNAKTIQIAHSSYGDSDIFSFMLIHPSLISQQINKKSKVQVFKKNIDIKVAKFLKINNIKKVMVLTFYKGLPLKNFGDIVEITKESIKILVDSKHQISLLKRDDILLITNEKKGTSILHGHVVENQENLFTIKNFTLSKDDMHLREGIRIKTFDDMKVLVDDKEYLVYDISEKGISIFIQDPIQEGLLKKKASLNVLLDDAVLCVDVKYVKTIYDEDGKELKIAFKIFSTNESDLIIHAYMNKKQNEIIKEIHRYHSDIGNGS